jgi:hypothetical protein
MDINNLPQLCVHLIKDYLADVIEKQRELMVSEYVATRIEAMSYEVEDWIASEKLTKKELGMFKEATTHHSFEGGKSIWLSIAMREPDWQPDGWRYKRAKAIEMKSDVLRSIDTRIYAASRLRHFTWGRDYTAYNLALTYEIYGVMEYLTAKRQGKKKTIKK